MEARFEAVVAPGARGPASRLPAWLGLTGTHPTLVQRFAAGAVVLVLFGSVTYVTTGVTPAAALQRAGHVVRSLVTNLDPRELGDGSAPGDPGAEATSEPTSRRTPTATAFAGSAATTAATPAPRTPDGTGAVPGLPGGPGTPTVAATSAAPGTASASPFPSPSATPAASPVTTPTPSVTPTATAAPGAQTSVHGAGVAGSVTLRRDGNTLTVVGVVPAAGWAFEIDQPAGVQVEVSFTRGGDRVRFEAHVVAGAVEVSVEERPADGGSGSGSSGRGNDGGSGSGGP